MSTSTDTAVRHDKNPLTDEDLYLFNEGTHAGLGAGLTDWGTHPLSH